MRKGKTQITMSMTLCMWRAAMKGESRCTRSLTIAARATPTASLVSQEGGSYQELDLKGREEEHHYQRTHTNREREGCGSSDVKGGRHVCTRAVCACVPLAAQVNIVHVFGATHCKCTNVFSIKRKSRKPKHAK